MRTEAIAWWGAILSTVVLLWDFYKWRRDRFYLRIRAVADPDGIEKDGFTISIANRGGKPTTIESFYLANYRFVVPAFLRMARTKESLFTINLSVVVNGQKEWPLVLNPGEAFETTGNLAKSEARKFDQVQDLPSLVKAGRLFLHVKCSHRDRPFKVRIRMLMPFDFV